MKKEFVSLKPDSTYEEAVALLYKNNATGAPVINEKNELVGYVSEKDLFRILYPYYQSYYEHPESYANGEKREEKANEIRLHKVETFMNTTPLTIGPDIPIMNAGAMLLARRIHQFPVVENDKVVGIISRESIYKTVFKNNFKTI